MIATKTISAKELKQWIDEGNNFTLIDTLPASSYEAHHIPTAHNADVRSVDFVERVTEAAPDKTKPLVLYCMSFTCTLTPLAEQKLAKAGYADVLVYEGGLADWQNAGYSFEGADAPKKISLVCDCEDCGCD